MAYNHYDYEEREYTPPKLQTSRSMWKFMILNILTLGIYSIFFFLPFSYDIDKAAPKKDRSKTMSFLFAYILSIFTFSIVITIWHYHIAARIEDALAEHNIDCAFTKKDFWLWGVLGSLVIVGSFVYCHKLCTAMNLLCDDYNERVNAR